MCHPELEYQTVMTLTLPRSSRITYTTPTYWLARVPRLSLRLSSCLSVRLSVWLSCVFFSVIWPNFWIECHSPHWPMTHIEKCRNYNIILPENYKKNQWTLGDGAPRAVVVISVVVVCLSLGELHVFCEHSSLCSRCCYFCCGTFYAACLLAGGCLVLFWPK